jgi:hypothetical protein
MAASSGQFLAEATWLSDSFRVHLKSIPLRASFSQAVSPWNLHTLLDTGHGFTRPSQDLSACLVTCRSRRLAYLSEPPCSILWIHAGGLACACMYAIAWQGLRGGGVLGAGAECTE